METKTKEVKREVVEVHTIYVAKDGTEFKDENECKDYEKSAKCAVRTRLKLDRITRDTEEVKDAYEALDAVLENGSAMAEYYVWKPESEDDIKNLLQYLNLIGLGITDRDWCGKASFRTNVDEIKVGETYILELYEDVYSGLINKKKFLNGMKNMFDILLSE